MGERIALVLVGFAAGLGAYQFFMVMMTQNINMTMCDICEYRAMKKKNRLKAVAEISSREKVEGASERDLGA